MIQEKQCSGGLDQRSDGDAETWSGNRYILLIECDRILVGSGWLLDV